VDKFIAEGKLIGAKSGEFRGFGSINYLRTPREGKVMARTIANLA